MPDQTETPAAPGDDAKPIVSGTAKYWREIERYEKATTEWKEEGEQIVNVYLDGNRESGSTTRRFALLWSNVETLKPATYAKVPVVICSRRFKDKDQTGRIAAEILERCANTTFDLYNVDETLRMVRDDRLLPGRGQAWVRYEARFNTIEAKGEEGKEGYEPGYDKLAGEKACVDYVHWQDFGHNVAKTWSDVWLTWRRVYKDKEEIEERFGEEKAEKLSYTAKPPDEKSESSTPKAVVYELWDKRDGKVCWLSKEFREFLEEPSKPPLNFRDFFPCPEPCFATKTSKSLIPTPDYRYYKDQAKEINDLTAKIDNLTKWLILKGFIASGPSSEGKDSMDALLKASSNEVVLVEVESWAGFAEKGGAGKMIEWLPLDQILTALKGMIEAREQLIQDVYQITGISDVLRGQTDPNETLGAQELKAQSGSRRVRNSKDEVARFAKDIAGLTVEVIAEMFQPQTLAAMSGMKYVSPEEKQQMMMAAQQQQPMQGQPGAQQAPQPQQQPQMESPSGMMFDDSVVALLRDDRERGFRIDIETDSTVQLDEDAEKQRRVEFMEAVGGFLEKSIPMLQMAPELTPMAKEMLLFTARGFRAGRNLEDVIDKSLEAVVQRSSQPQPDPKQQQMQQEMMQSKAEHEQKMQFDAQRMQFDQVKHQQELQQNQQEFEQTLAMKKTQGEQSIELKKQAAKAKPAPANGKGGSPQPDRKSVV